MKKEIIEYKEPGYLPDSITNHHFDIDKIDEADNSEDNIISLEEQAEIENEEEIN